MTSNSVTDASMVKDLLLATYTNVVTCTDKGRYVEDFDHHMPQVLVLAFDELSDAERYHLGLHRRSAKIHQLPHRTIILCDKKEVRQVAHLCLEQSFDDYVLFWPMNHDAQRLQVSVHHALRDLARVSEAGPSIDEFAVQARRLAELETLLDQQLELGRQHLDNTNRAIKRTEYQIGAGFEGFSQRLGSDAFAQLVDVKDAGALQREMAGMFKNEIQPLMRAVSDSLEPAAQWGLSLKQQLEPGLDPARALGAMADQVRPAILVVDDDALQRKLIAKMLEKENYRLAFASSGIDALNVLGRAKPDLILMDVQMPGMDGVETTRRLKALPGFSGITVIMITGQSEGKVVVDSMSAGASDFLVKPVHLDKLVTKVAHWLRPKKSRVEHASELLSEQMLRRG